jgi:hypothetical protein
MGGMASRIGEIIIDCPDPEPEPFHSLGTVDERP